MDLLEIFNRPVATTFVDKNPELKSIFRDAGVFVTSGEIVNALNSNQPAVIIPHLLEPDYNLEANYSNDIYNDIAEPRMLEFGATRARVAYMNEGWTASALALQLSAANPNELIAKRANKYWTAQMQMRAIATAYGIYNMQAKDKKLTTTADKFDAAAFIGAKSSITTGIKGIMVTSQANKMTMVLSQLQIPGTNPNELKTVDVYNDYIVVTNDKYTKLAGGETLSILFGESAMVAESKPNPRDLRVETAEARGNGGGVDTLWTRRDAIVHPQGFNFTSAKITGGTKNQALSASLTDLTDPTNWELAGGVEDTAIRFLVTK